MKNAYVVGFNFRDLRGHVLDFSLSTYVLQPYIFPVIEIPSNLKWIRKKKSKIGEKKSKNDHSAPVSYTKLYFFIQAILGISIKDLDFRVDIKILD